MRAIGYLVCLTASVPLQANAEPYRQILTSTSRNIDVKSWEVSSCQVTPDASAPWSVRKLTLHGGKQEGVALIIVDNGKLRFTVVPTRGMGILSVTMDKVRLGWDSPVKEVVHPHFVNLESRGGLGWLDGFNEWMCRCGLEFMGHPGPDKFITNVGDEATMDLTLHGKIANIPAQEVEVVVDRQPPYRIRIRGRVDERMFFGPKLELQTEISTVPGSAALRIADVVTNHGAQDQEFEVLYHTNFGRPLLEGGSTFLAPVERVTPFNATAAKGVAAYATYGPPQPGFIEQVFCMNLLADSDGRTRVMLRNKAKDLAVSLTYPLKALPCFTLWKNTTAEKEGYVTGLEPGTNHPYNRRIERKFGRVLKLAPGASHQVTLDVDILVGVDQVKGAADRIGRIQGSRRTAVDAAPPKID